MKLGRKAGVVHDRRTLQAAKYIQTQAVLPKAPKSVQHTRGLTFTMAGNDSYGDCTFAAKVHLDHGVGRKAEPADQAVVDAYLKFTHGQDTGAYELDVLNDWRKQDDGVGGKITAYAAVKLTDRELVHAACWLFGGLYIGISLPLSAQSQVGKTWKPVDGPEGKPGSWGGHAVYLPNSNLGGSLTCITWGQKQKLTWDFWLKYVDEAYAVIHPDWLRKSGATPQGFHLAQLQTDLSLI